MKRTRIAVAGAAVLATAGIGTGLALTANASGSAGTPAAGATGEPGYSYYQSVMGGLGPGTMMRGAPGAPTSGTAGYQWMMGGASTAPGWMIGGTIPGSMMGGATDPGRAMGSLWANAPGPRVSSTDAARLGNQVPTGATTDPAARRLTFTTHDVSLTVVASPSMPSENFRVAGMTDPTITVPTEAHVTIQLINADTDMAHGLVIAPAGAASTRTPMMSATPAFPGAALWFLGESSTTGMHTGTLIFTAGAAGSYQYLCPVPGHAQEGMAGSFVVTGPGT